VPAERCASANSLVFRFGFYPNQPAAVGRCRGLAALLVTLSLCPAADLPARGAGTARADKVRLAVGSLPGNLVYLQLDLCRALGYFTEQGLAVDFQYFDGGTPAARALDSGQAEFSGNSIDHAFRPRRSGGDFQMIASFTNLPTVTLVVRHDLRPSIRSLKDLKGKRLGVTALSAGTHVMAASILKKVGYSLNDVEVVPAGSGMSLVTALKRKQVDVAMSTDPTTTRLLLSGDASLLLDMVTYEETQRVFTGGYQFTGLLTRPDLIEQHPEVVQKMVNAVIRANRFIATHSAADIAAALPADIVQDRYVYVKSLEHSRPSLSKDGLVTLMGVSNNIQSQVAFGTISASAGLDPAKFFDMRFVESALKAWKTQP
jgi:sulfonate transport system substrate-binding protein